MMRCDRWVAVWAAGAILFGGLDADREGGEAEEGSVGDGVPTPRDPGRDRARGGVAGAHLPEKVDDIEEEKEGIPRPARPHGRRVPTPRWKWSRRRRGALSPREGRPRTSPAGGVTDA